MTPAAERRVNHPAALAAEIDAPVPVAALGRPAAALGAEAAVTLGGKLAL